MSWSPLSPLTLQRYLAAPQLRALQTAALADEQADPIPEIVADLTARVRAELRAGGGVLSAEPMALPPELHGPAAALVLEAAQTRLPSLELTTAQVRAADEARALLERFANGKLRAEPPADPEEPPPVWGAETVVLSLRPHRVTAQRLRI
ncbi:MAG: Uncharacterized protein E1N59_2276 [Puniceicoccaceae bacterium 5H]|nr:MAG: Uncharacterized protein E1N59_2276 [Puniceicoccaceae bacterium 5H]